MGTCGCNVENRHSRASASTSSSSLPCSNQHCHDQCVLVLKPAVYLCSTRRDIIQSQCALKMVIGLAVVLSQVGYQMSHMEHGSYQIQIQPHCGSTSGSNHIPGTTSLTLSHTAQTAHFSHTTSSQLSLVAVQPYDLPELCCHGLPT